MAIPFKNMSQAEADNTDWSPYAKFCQTLHGYYVFHIRTQEKWSKSELFVAYSESPEELQMISDRTHPNFKFILQDEW